MLGYGLCVPEIDAWEIMIRWIADADSDEEDLPASNDIFSLSVSFESTSIEAMMVLIKATLTNNENTRM
jgi:hypothetical protein